PGCWWVGYAWVPALTNGFAGGIIYADSCFTNDFRKPKEDGEVRDAVSELFVKGPTGGAAAYIGDSSYSLIGVGSELEKRCWESLSVNRRVGIAHQSKANYLSEVSLRWANYTLNLMGGPEMPVWLEKPERLIGVHPASITKGDSLLVRVTDPDGGFV